MTQTTAKIAVQIVTHNNAETIAICLRTLQAQTIPFELCIIDNASDDGTAECIEALGYPLIRNSRNAGYSAAHNQALKRTLSPYVLTLNADVMLMSDFLEQVVQAFEENPNAGALAGMLLRVDELGDDPYCVDSCGLAMRPYHRQVLRWEGHDWQKVPKERVYIFGPDGAAAVYRRAMLSDIAIEGEIFDEDFFIHKEDVDICWRAQLRGWGALFIPEARAHHIRGFRPGQRGAASAEARYYGVRNRYLLLLKHSRTALLVRHGLAMLAYDAAILGYMLLFEQRSLRALADVARLAAKMWRKREAIRERQIVPDRALLRWFRWRGW